MFTRAIACYRLRTVDVSYFAVGWLITCSLSAYKGIGTGTRVIALKEITRWTGGDHSRLRIVECSDVRLFNNVLALDYWKYSL